MLKTRSNALRVVEATLGKVKKVSRPVAKFMVHIMELWLSMNCRYVFANMQRWGGKAEKSYRRMFQKFFDWFSFNLQLVKQTCGGEIIAVFDPCFIKKSGKRTYGLDKFWSGTAGKALKGLEVGCLCFVDVEAGTALHALAEQTPPQQILKQKGQTLVSHYVGVVKKHLNKILKVSRYLAADGYFMKREFICPLLQKGLHLITKARRDANFRYLYKGPHKQTRGRPKLYEGKVDTGHIDKRRIQCCYRDSEVKIYTAVVYAMQLKMKVLAAFVYYRDKEQPEIIISTDTQMDALVMCRYYGLRFQVEFLIRDAKQYAGMEDCQARSKQKLHTHFNVALTAVSLAKAVYYLSLPKEKRDSFSMADIKMLHMNQLITNRIFINLELDQNDRKIKQLYHQCLNFVRLRA
ncbi:transposase [Chitinophagaceae bacterium LB-8]|uniref:Transposase n=1 Tax=Paraflavisolibacter caeni TaxID=2982496 RepID=A0A9X3B9U5_9BACT|nr:transposase [Paraflavisolibacter caeni]MCU7552485.1 transposase [Paraflavisolibacter caeni]